jgi:hypothetical protein
MILKLNIIYSKNEEELKMTSAEYMLENVQGYLECAVDYIEKIIELQNAIKSIQEQLLKCDKEINIYDSPDLCEFIISGTIDFNLNYANNCNDFIKMCIQDIDGFFADLGKQEETKE